MFQLNSVKLVFADEDDVIIRLGVVLCCGVVRFYGVPGSIETAVQPKNTISAERVIV